ncbi:hypothetical protein ACIRBY_37150 [Streptomyces sp. NPDC096136]|uniref:hypothetical protein n=1 Tax=Streptomyces sp. NPDC096136 TaxID=3366076 RepID=UPI00381B7FAB
MSENYTDLHDALDTATTLDDIGAVIQDGAVRRGLTPAQLLDQVARSGRVNIGTPPVPAVRILTKAEYQQAYERMTGSASRSGNRLGRAAYEVLDETLAAIGVFAPAPHPNPDTCTALYLPTDHEEFDRHVFAQWQQCTDEPGHDGDEHDNGEVNWADGMPGAIPATAP